MYRASTSKVRISRSGWVDLSGGERNRVHLAKLLRRGANVLLLDEPTNDLDVETLRALEEALLNFPGTVLVISHDRWFLDRIATHILAFEGDSHVEWFAGNFSDYETDHKKRLSAAGIDTTSKAHEVQTADPVGFSDPVILSPIPLVRPRSAAPRFPQRPHTPKGRAGAVTGSAQRPSRLTTQRKQLPASAPGYTKANTAHAAKAFAIG